MKFYDSPAPNPYVVRLFACERGGLTFDVQQIDVVASENRRFKYRNEVNRRGEVPALRLDNGTVLTEITAICEYLDEIAEGGTTLIGSNAQERAETRMWLRRMDLELAQPLFAWFRNDPATIDFYKGNRTPCPEARVTQKVVINQFLNLLDDELEGKTYLCGDRFSAADIHFYGMVSWAFEQIAPWFNTPGRKNVRAYFERMVGREATKKAEAPFPSKITL